MYLDAAEEPELKANQPSIDGHQRVFTTDKREVTRRLRAR